MKIIIFFIYATLIFGQNDFKRWEKKIPNYEKNMFKIEKDSESNNNVFSFILGNTQKVYKTLISDLDGENCPFYPSCSNFYVQSVKESGIFQGTLMFFDRFTRDMNVFRDRKDYEELPNGKLFDPVSNYMLKPDKIKLKFKN